MAPNFKRTTLAHSRLSFLLNSNNMAWSFVGKYEQVNIAQNAIVFCDMYLQCAVNNWINRLSESQLNTDYSRKRIGSCQSKGLMRIKSVLVLTACDGQTNICQMAKEMSGTLTSISSLRFSFVNRSKQLI